MNTKNVGLTPDDIAKKGTHDFHGFTAAEAAPGQAASMASKRTLDGWVSEQKEKPGWLALYQELLAEQGTKATSDRWDWRKCLYVAWRCVPARARWPATLDELASFMGLRNTATIRHWRLKDGSIEERIKTLRVQLVDEHVSDLLQAALDCALGDEKGHQDRKMLLEIAGVYRQKVSQEVGGPGGAPLKMYTVMANPDMWDDDENNVGTATVASGAVEG